MNFSPQWNDIKNAGAAATGIWSSTMSPPPAPSNTPAASRLVYIVLAIFLGVLGIHNFVIGLTGRGATQLALTLTGFVLSFCTFGAASILIVAAFVWSIIDIVTIKTDARGLPLN